MARYSYKAKEAHVYPERAFIFLQGFSKRVYFLYFFYILQRLLICSSQSAKRLKNNVCMIYDFDLGMLHIHLKIILLIILATLNR